MLDRCSGCSRAWQPQQSPPPHIHIAVIHPAYEELVTRYVVRRGTTAGRIRIVLTPLL